MNSTRRDLLIGGLGLLVGGGAGAVGTVVAKDQPKSEDVSAAEDLMREHGVLNRILLIYEGAMRHMDIYDDVGREAFHRAANLVRTFVEDYHERLEERFLFPEFERRNRQAALVGVLRRQHQAGRALTDIIQRNSIGAIFQRSDARQELVRACEAFIRMYRPHEAREDTVLFPELHDILSAKQLRELGERFEEEEDRLFGEGGFQNTVGQVAEIERQLGTLDLDQFTPRLTGSHGS